MNFNEAVQPTVNLTEIEQSILFILILRTNSAERGKVFYLM